MTPFTEGLEAGRGLTKTYFDLITLEPGSQGMVVARGSPSGLPAVVGGPAGKGCFVAVGMCLGLGQGEKDAKLTPVESRLLRNAVRWVAEKN